jgi:hypothetical protein
LVETFYSQGIFHFIRYFFDFTIGKLPFPSIYLLITAIIALGWHYAIKWIKTFRIGTFRFGLIVKTIVDLLTFCGVLVLAFYWLWGFNYKRIDFQNRNHLPSPEITEQWLFNELSLAHSQLVKLKNRGPAFNQEKMEQLSRNALLPVLKEAGYAASGNVRVKNLNPSGVLLIWSTAGVYVPFVAQGHIDQGLHEITQPFTLTHEMAHGYGVTEESTCNFLAFLSCINSKDAFMQYSGWMGYFRYLLSACRKSNPEAFSKFVVSMDPAIKADLESIYEQLNRFPELLPIIRDKIYNSYLKSHGIAEGTVNYSMMIQLASSWKIKYKSYSLVSSQ